jgi:virginiamycin B lyase
MRFLAGVTLVVLGACTITSVNEGPIPTAGEAANTTEASTTSTAGVGSSTTAPSTSTTSTIAPPDLVIEVFPVPAGSRPHDVAPAADGGVWYTAQGSGDLGWLDPETGETRHISLGVGSQPHGVIVDSEGTPWITDGGINSIVSVDPDTEEVTIHPLPDADPINLNTAVFDENGLLWFTGQAGAFGALDVTTGETELFPAPQGPGPYGITATPDGRVVFASLAGSYVGEILADGEVTVFEPPTVDQGARRVWSDSTGSIWVSEWNSGNVSRLDLDTGEWDTWSLPGEAAAYAVYVDEADIVWLSDFGANALVRFDPGSEAFNVYPLPDEPGDVRQIHGRPGEIWGAESAADQLVLIRTR